MQIINAKFITSAASAADWGKFNLPEIAVAGRSNAGKSSFINMIAENSKLARTSKEAGKTRCVNYYQCTAKDKEQFSTFHLTDLPGYGYSTASKTVTETFSALTDEYIRTSENLLHVLVLVDIRIPPARNDLQLIDFLYRRQKPFTVLAVKADKLSRLQTENQRTLIARELKMGRDDIIALSNTTGAGRPRIEELFCRILSAERSV
ncbi:putative GTP-binding protein EngB [Clostridia bacterium]|nr:putative GTP-binding protein EngB [Clostridia bacterium]